VLTLKSAEGSRLREIDRYLRGEASSYAPVVPAWAADLAPLPEPAGASARDGDGAASGGASPPPLLRVFYFLLVGAWLSVAWTVLAWLLDVSIVGIPVAMAMVERLPLVMTLRSSPVPASGPAPRRTPVPWPLAVVYFLTLGLWLSYVVAN